MAQVYQIVFYNDKFNKPYLTHSITEFLEELHITLSNWFRDYVYIPLGGSKKDPCRETLIY